LETKGVRRRARWSLGAEGWSGKATSSSPGLMEHSTSLHSLGLSLYHLIPDFWRSSVDLFSSPSPPPFHRSTPHPISTNRSATKSPSSNPSRKATRTSSRFGVSLGGGKGAPSRAESGLGSPAQRKRFTSEVTDHSHFLQTTSKRRTTVRSSLSILPPHNSHLTSTLSASQPSLPRHRPLSRGRIVRSHLRQTILP